MPEPTASVQSNWQEPQVIAEIGVRVYALEPGQTQIQISWPAEALADTAEGQSKRDQFLRFIQSELELITGS
jgi:hypothetical protein